MKNYWGAIAIAVLAFAGLFIAACGITDPGNWVKVSVPAGMREIGDPARISVNEAEDLVREKTSALELLVENVIGGKQEVAAWKGVIGAMAESVNVAGMEIPGWTVFGGSAIFGGILGALGIRRPGDVPAPVAKANEDKAWDESKNETIALLKKQV